MKADIAYRSEMCELENKVMGLTSNVRELITHLRLDWKMKVDLQKDQVNISNTAKTYQEGHI